MNEEKEKKRGHIGAIIIIVVLFIIGMALVGTSENDKNISTQYTDTSTNSSNVQSGTQETTNNINKQKEFKVGETCETNTLRIKYLELDDNFKGYSRYATIKDGYKIIKAEFEFENLSTQDEYVSSYDFECYADGYVCEEFYSVDESSLGANLSSGKKGKGAVFYEVPNDASNIILEFELNSWTGAKVTFVVK